MDINKLNNPTEPEKDFGFFHSNQVTLTDILEEVDIQSAFMSEIEEFEQLEIPIERYTMDIQTQIQLDSFNLSQTEEALREDNTLPSISTRIGQCSELMFKSALSKPLKEVEGRVQMFSIFTRQVDNKVYDMSL